jgi:hypothetical protein
MEGLLPPDVQRALHDGWGVPENRGEEMPVVNAHSVRTGGTLPVS